MLADFWTSYEVTTRANNLGVRSAVGRARAVALRRMLETELHILCEGDRTGGLVAQRVSPRVLSQTGRTVMVRDISRSRLVEKARVERT